MFQRALRVRRQIIFYLQTPVQTVAINVQAVITITEITPENVNYVQTFRNAETARVFFQFLNEDQLGVYAWLDSRVVGHAWAKVCRNTQYRANGYLDICQNEALIHYCYVDENHRGKNIYPAMLIALCENLHFSRGVARILIDTEVDNIASIRGIQKAGFTLLGTGTYVQFVGHLIWKRFICLEKIGSNFQKKHQDGKLPND